MSIDSANADDNGATVMGLFEPLQRKSAESKTHSFILLFRKLVEKIKKNNIENILSD